MLLDDSHGATAQRGPHHNTDLGVAAERRVVLASPRVLQLHCEEAFDLARLKQEVEVTGLQLLARVASALSVVSRIEYFLTWS